VLVYGSDDLDESNSVLVVIRSCMQRCGGGLYYMGARPKAFLCAGRSTDYPDVDVPHDPKHVRIDCHGCIRATVCCARGRCTV
jgi:hypothetical protein